MKTPAFALVAVLSIALLATACRSQEASPSAPSPAGQAVRTPCVDPGPAPTVPGPTYSPGAFADTKKGPLPNPDAGLSDEERNAKYERLRAEGEQRMTDWVNNLDLSKLDLRSVPRVKMSPDTDAPPASLREAVAKADLIVVATIEGIQPTAFGGMITTLSIEQTVKGPAAEKVTIRQGFGPFPSEDGTGVELEEDEGAPILLPGDRAVLFLEDDARTGYWIQRVSGWYQVVCGSVHTAPGSQFESSISGDTEASFLGRLRQSLH